MHTEADRKGGNKLREKARANWLSRDQTCRLRKWQACVPELEKKQALEGNGWRDRQRSQPRAAALAAPLCSGLSRAYIYVQWHWCHIFRVCSSPWRSKTPKRYLKPLMNLGEFQNCSEWRTLATISFLIRDVLGLIISQRDKRQHSYDTHVSLLTSQL